jgi:hypothetical protein
VRVLTGGAICLLLVLALVSQFFLLPLCLADSLSTITLRLVYRPSADEVVVAVGVECEWSAE